MNSKKYWEKREAEALKHRITDEKEYDRQIKRIYANMLDACQSEIDAFYGKYADKEGITIAEAKKRVKPLDIAAYERKAKRYVKEKDFSAQANEEMRLYNATMKINRLELLKANIGLELISGHDELEKFMGGILKGRTEDELKRQAGILGESVANNAKKAEAIVNASFHNATFSDRVWMYQDLMKDDLDKALQSGLIQGKNPRALAKNIKEIFYGGDPKKDGGYRYCAERLMQSELARVQTGAQKQSFERNGFDKYSFLVNGGCCVKCEEAAKQDVGYGKGVYLVKDMMPGENAPPMHCWCKCSTAAYEDSEDYEAWLSYLDKGGTTEEWENFKRAEAEFAEAYKEKEKITKSRKFAVDGKMLDGRAYADKISRMADDAETRREFLSKAKAMLRHRSGQNGEDLYLYNSVTKKWVKSTTGKFAGTPDYTQEIRDAIANAEKGELIAFHNHPDSLPPSPNDLNAALRNGYKRGYALCHNGRIFSYTAPSELLDPTIFDLRVAKYKEEGYNTADAQYKAMKKLAEQYGFEFEEVT